MESMAGIKDRSIFVNSIYETIQGEGLNAGLPVILIRFQGCNLSCKFCDAVEAQKQNRETHTSMANIMEMVESSTVRNILVTGGEPFMQPSGLLALFYSLRSQFQNCRIFVESNGTIDTPILPCFIPFFGSACHLTISPKIDNLPLSQYIHLASEVRCPIEDASDIDEYDTFLNRVGYEGPRLLSPIFDEWGGVDDDVARDCVDWVINDTTGVYRLSVQIHKFLGVQ